MNNFFNDVEVLKKEVWHLKNKTIKDLIEEVAGLTGGDLDSTLTGRISAIESQVGMLESKVVTLENDIVSNGESVADLSQHVAELGVVVSELKSSLEGIKADIEDLKSADELLSGSINTTNDNLSELSEDLQAKISSIETLVNNLYENENVFDASLTSLEVRVDELEEKVDAMSGISDDGLAERVAVVESQIANLSVKDEEHESAITSLESGKTKTNENVDKNAQDISALQGAVGEIEVDVSDLFAGFEELAQVDIQIGEKIDGIEEEHGNLKSAVEANTAKIEELQNASGGEELETLKQSVNLNIARIDALESSDAEQIENIAGAQADITSLNETASSLSAAFETLEATASSNSTALSALQAEVEIIKGQIENMGSGGGETVDLLYDKDSTDEAINHGFTDGLHCNDYVNVDVDLYSKYRIYMFLYNSDDQKDIHFDGRQRIDSTFMAISNNARKMYIGKAALIAAYKRVQMGQYAIYSYSVAEGTWTVEVGTSHDNIYIYRIEGIRK